MTVLGSPRAPETGDFTFSNKFQHFTNTHKKSHTNNEVDTNARPTYNLDKGVFLPSSNSGEEELE